MGDEGGFDNPIEGDPEEVGRGLRDAERLADVIEDTTGTNLGAVLGVLISSASMAASHRLHDMLEPPETTKAFDAAIREAKRFGLPDTVNKVFKANALLHLLTGMFRVPPDLNREEIIKRIETSGVTPRQALRVLAERAQLTASIRHQDMLEPPDTTEKFDASLKQAARFGLSEEPSDVLKTKMALWELTNVLKE